MALSLDSSTPANVVKAAAGNTATTASFTAPANALIIAFWAQDETGTVTTTIADTGGLTWTRIYRLCTITIGEANTPTPTGTAQDGYISAWQATTSSSTSRTVTVTEAGAGGTGKEGMLSVKVFTDTGGAPTVGAVGSAGGSASAPTMAVTTTATNSWVWAGSNDWSASGTGTAGAGQTMVDTNDTANDAQHCWRQTSTTAGSGTSVTMNLTAPASQTWNIGVVEILANSAAGASGGAQPARPGRTWARRFHRRLTPIAPPAATDTPITLPGDTGTGTDDLTLTAAVPLADTGTGTDALTLTATVPLSDLATGTDALAVNAAVPLSETGTGTDTLTTAASIPLADTGTGTDALTTVTVTVNLSDTGALVDDMTVDTGSTPKSLSDAGAGTEALTASATAAIAETTSGTDALTVSATVTPAADTGTLTDAMTVARAIPLAETAGFVEAFSVTVTAGLSDLATLTEGFSVNTGFANGVPVVNPGLALTSATSDLAVNATAPSLPLTGTDSGLILTSPGPRLELT